MSIVAIKPFLQYSPRRTHSKKHGVNSNIPSHFSFDSVPRRLSGSSRFNFRQNVRSRLLPLRASSSTDTAVVEVSEFTDVIFKETFPLKLPEKVEGKISIRLVDGEDPESWHLHVRCNIPGKWILHWGVNYIGDTGSEWDQPPPEMIPNGSVPIKDYAIESPLEKSSNGMEGETFYEAKIDFNTNSSIAAINFVLKNEETGSWYQHRGRDFKVPLIDYLSDDGNIVGAKRGIGLWPALTNRSVLRKSVILSQKGLPVISPFLLILGTLGQLTNIPKSEGVGVKVENSSNGSRENSQRKRGLEEFYEEHSIVQETLVDHYVGVSVKQCPGMAKKLVCMETDLQGDVTVHWGVCKDESKQWEVPDGPYPSNTTVFKDKALRTLLQRKEDDHSAGSFILDEGLVGFTFVLKINESTWLNCMGKDFYIPLSSSEERNNQFIEAQPGYSSQANELVSAFPDGIINDIRNLVSDISSQKNRKAQSIEAQEIILQEIEKLAAEAYSIFRNSIPTFSEDTVTEVVKTELPVRIASATGSGFEVLCQGFNWESHKSGRWYTELLEKTIKLASIGFTVIWLPPPTDSVSPEGYMPRDLYNLNSRYGNVEQLKSVVNKFHKVGVKVLGDVVLNHRCAQHQNANGVWNIFGGRLNWDDRAVVADDPHFQGRGNKSSGDNFHAAPNIDHSQDFVRKDLKEWLCWLRKEIGYDGWRLDFVRGFWGGYVKDYIGATEPYFAVGEYWDSLSYTYGEMDHNQDAHRQRIVDWINDTNGSAGAFDVTTKGILHSAIERCEYWRLSDQKGKPPGVVGWWPSRAITFIENHDTGSTQGHWRFPGGKEMLGYAYILTHPGTPSVFYDHIFSDNESQIAALISIRNRNQIHCRSSVKITKAERDVYAAITNEKVAVKIGPGYYEPEGGSNRWSLVLQGRDYKVWEAL